MIWNLLSPFWDNIASLIFDKLVPTLKKVYKKVPKKIRKIIICSIIGISILGSIFISKKIINNKDIAIVDLEIKKADNVSKAVIDIVIKNNNIETDILINKAIIHISDYYEMAYANSDRYYRLEPSYTYDVIIDGEKIPENKNIKLSQVVPAGGYDNFSFEIASCKKNIFRQILVKINCEFFCDNNENIKTGECILALGCDLFDENALYMSGDIWRSIYDNYVALKKFASFDSEYVMDEFNKVFISYKNYEELIMTFGKKQYLIDMSHKNRILNYDDFMNHMKENFEKIVCVKKGKQGKNHLYTLNLQGVKGDEKDRLYILVKNSMKILSIYVPVITNKKDLIGCFNHIFICNSFINEIDPSINSYWYEQRIVDLEYHKNVRFWKDENIYAKFVKFKEKSMLRFDLK